MLKTILTIISFVFKFISDWREDAKKRAKNKWSDFRANYELEKDKRRRRADSLVDSVDELLSNKNKLP